MEKDYALLDLYEGRRVIRQSLEEFCHKNNEYEFVYEYENRYFGYVVYTIKIHIKDERVKYIILDNTIDISYGHGRPTSGEYRLSAADWKHVRDIMEACTVKPSMDLVEKITARAVSQQVQCDGYTIQKATAKTIRFLSRSGEPVILTKKTIWRALQYAYHIPNVLSEISAVRVFREKLSRGPAEPLMAILSVATLDDIQKAYD